MDEIDFLAIQQIAALPAGLDDAASRLEHLRGVVPTRQQRDQLGIHENRIELIADFMAPPAPREGRIVRLTGSGYHVIVFSIRHKCSETHAGSVNGSAAGTEQANQTQ